MTAFRAGLLVALALATIAFLRFDRGLAPGSAALAAPPVQLGDNGNGNDNGSLAPTGPPPAAAAPAGGTGVCALPGQQTLITSADGRVSLRVFPTLARAVRISVDYVEPTAVAAVPGVRVDGFVVWLRAEFCEGGALGALPAEANLGFHYADADAAGLAEQNFGISWLDPVSNTWKLAPKQAADPPANYASATITDLGVYALHQK